MGAGVGGSVGLPGAGVGGSVGLPGAGVGGGIGGHVPVGLNCGIHDAGTQTSLGHAIIVSVPENVALPRAEADTRISASLI